MKLSSQQMEIIGSSWATCDIDIDWAQLFFIFQILSHITVIITQLQKSLNSTWAVLRSLPIHSVWQIHNESWWLIPFSLCTDNKVIDHDLGSICKISKLSLPNN